MSLQLRNNATTAIASSANAVLQEDDDCEQIDTMEDDFSAQSNDEIDYLLKHDPAYRHWIYNEVIPSFKAMKANPSSGCSIEEVRAFLSALHAKRQ